MSDGPHKSLPMRPGWKKVAEFADNRAFTADEVSVAAADACAKDWREFVPETLTRSVCDVLGAQQASLFHDNKAPQLEGLRGMTAGRGFAGVFIDCAIHQTISGKSGIDAAVEAIAQAHSIWGGRHARQIEEHYYRKSTEQRALKVRARIEAAISRVSGYGLARQLLKLDAAPTRRTRRKQSDLDDGVGL